MMPAPIIKQTLFFLLNWDAMFSTYWVPINYHSDFWNCSIWLNSACFKAWLQCVNCNTNIYYDIRSSHYHFFFFQNFWIILTHLLLYKSLKWFCPVPVTPLGFWLECQHMCWAFLGKELAIFRILYVSLQEQTVCLCWLRLWCQSGF